MKKCQICGKELKNFYAKACLKHSKNMIYIWCPTHPFNKDRYYPEHRLIMEKHIGRILLLNDVAHHINSNQSDNRIENLMLFSSHSEHMRFHSNNTLKRNLKTGRFISKRGER